MLKDLLSSISSSTFFAEALFLLGVVSTSKSSSFPFAEASPDPCLVLQVVCRPCSSGGSLFLRRLFALLQALHLQPKPRSSYWSTFSLSLVNLQFAGSFADLGLCTSLSPRLPSLFKFSLIGLLVQDFASIWRYVVHAVHICCWITYTPQDRPAKLSEILSFLCLQLIFYWCFLVELYNDGYFFIYPMISLTKFVIVVTDLCLLNGLIFQTTMFLSSVLLGFISADRCQAGLHTYIASFFFVRDLAGWTLLRRAGPLSCSDFDRFLHERLASALLRLIFSTKTNPAFKFSSIPLFFINSWFGMVNIGDIAFGVFLAGVICRICVFLGVLIDYRTYNFSSTALLRSTCVFFVWITSHFQFCYQICLIVQIKIDFFIQLKFD